MGREFKVESKGVSKLLSHRGRVDPVAIRAREWPILPRANGSKSWLSASRLNRILP
jgi:hypothetical protein